MITIRQSIERGHSKLSLLDSHHSFSFADYYDPNHMGFGVLRVLNDDIVAPGMGFDTHSHSNMEIVSIVLEGTMAHKDSTGNEFLIKAGDVQRMSAGTGITHSETNHSNDMPLHFLQIWFLPEIENVTPAYQQQLFSNEQKKGKICPLVTKHGDNGTLSINQNVSMYAANITGDDKAQFAVNPTDKIWVQLAKGALTMNNLDLKEGDGAAIENESKLQFSNGDAAEVILIVMSI